MSCSPPSRFLCSRRPSAPPISSINSKNARPSASRLVLDVEGDTIKSARAVVGSVSAAPTQSDQANSLLAGARSQVEKQLADAAEALAQAADPVDDLEGGAEYKRHLIGVFLRRAFVKALS